MPGKKSSAVVSKTRLGWGATPCLTRWLRVVALAAALGMSRGDLMVSRAGWQRRAKDWRTGYVKGVSGLAVPGCTVGVPWRGLAGRGTGRPHEGGQLGAKLLPWVYCWRCVCSARAPARVFGLGRAWRSYHPTKVGSCSKVAMHSPRRWTSGNAAAATRSARSLPTLVLQVPFGGLLRHRSGSGEGQLVVERTDAPFAVG